MKIALLLCLFLVSCAPKPKVYTKPEIGISFNEFSVLCNVQGELATAKTVTTAQGETFTIKLTETPERFGADLPKRDLSCVGEFVFLDGKLTTMTR